jgi:uncharacterized protein involved in exopolysaccharide biosynthesis
MQENQSIFDELIAFGARIANGARRRVYALIGILFIFVFVGLAHALTAKIVYRAETVVAVKNSGASVLGLGGLSGLASLAGIGSGGFGESGTNLAQLSSQRMAMQFISEHKLDNEIREISQVSIIGGLLGGDTNNEYDSRKTLKVFEEEIISVREDRKTGLVTVSMRWSSAEDAASWANDYVRMANRIIREKDLADAKWKIDYLKAELGAEDVVAVQAAIAELLEAELKKLLIIQSDEQYAFKVIDPATPPMLRESPKRARIMIGYLFGAMLFSLVVASARFSKSPISTG